MHGVEARGMTFVKHNQGSVSNDDTNQIVIVALEYTLLNLRIAKMLLSPDVSIFSETTMAESRYRALSSPWGCFTSIEQNCSLWSFVNSVFCSRIGIRWSSFFYAYSTISTQITKQIDEFFVCFYRFTTGNESKYNTSVSFAKVFCIWKLQSACYVCRY